MTQTDDTSGFNISIEIDSEPPNSFKSIKNIVWNDIPPLAVLTGLNGAGKSQLLDFLNLHITKTLRSSHPRSDAISVKIKGAVFEISDVAYVPRSGAFGGVGQVGLSQLQAHSQQIWQTLFQRPNTDTKSIQQREKMKKALNKKANEAVSQKDIEELLLVDPSIIIDYQDIISDISTIFYGYFIDNIYNNPNALGTGQTPGKLNTPPWAVVNAALSAAGFPYSLTQPPKNLRESYHLKLEEIETGEKRNLEDLSSGEKIILHMVLWLYASSHHGKTPKLLLLDEPDAHLHPSLTRQFLNVVKSVLVEKYKARVILTTHSPSTVALAPPESIFVMRRGDPLIQRAASKEEVVGFLTSGLVIVSPSSRFVLVEDQSDISFYEAIRSILSDYYAETRDARVIKPAPTIVFLPASTGNGEEKRGGGKSVVKGWLDKFDDPPLKELFRGIIDRDINNTSAGRIYAIGRYAIENYLVDPLIVYGFLLAEGKLSPLEDVPITQGNEHQLRALPKEKLQKIVDYIITIVETKQAELRQTIASKEVTFTNGIKLTYPSWMIDHDAHKLLPKFQQAFFDSNGPKIMTPPELIKSLLRVRLIPVELADIMDQIQR